MADRVDDAGKLQRITPPRFGRNVSRPRVLHALEVVEEGVDVLDEIDRLIQEPRSLGTTAFA